MRTTIKQSNNENGFSLLEIAIVIVLIGLIITPAIGIYHNYRVDKDWRETEDALNVAINEIGGFRSVYSKYPCPASQTAVPGDLNYGFEDCTVNASGSCVNGICTYDSNIAGRVVVVGSLPFKTINMQESESYDSNLNRLRYAVTRDLTSSSTFDVNGGGIGIVDKSGASVISPNDEAHFIVLSHGQNKIAGYTRAGLQGYDCTTGSLEEQENCDDDSVFLSGEIDNNFDDRVKFFSNVMASDWQIAESDRDAIHLKNISNNLAVGADIEIDDLSLAETVTVRRSSSTSGTVRASNDFRAESLCEYDASSNVDCFAPRLIAGSLDQNTGDIRLQAETSSGSGISCYKPSQGEDGFLVGIENGDAICEEEIFVYCPNGSFVKGVDSDGTVICDAAPEAGCENMNITTTCGDTRTLEETISGEYREVYSGECRMITDYDQEQFEIMLAGLTVAEIQTEIDNINNEERTVGDCAVATSQVRDTYQCSAGTWNHISAHERQRRWDSYPDNPNIGQPWTAEISYMGDDPENYNDNHDCWCREDYRLVTYSCPNSDPGMRIRILKHVCPQTSHHWTRVYTDDQCACVPGTEEVTLSCNEYYDQVNETSGTTGLSGSVDLVYEVTCVNGEQVTSTTPMNTPDVSNCFCPSNDPDTSRTYCDTGETNSWSWYGGDEVGVAELTVSDWVCPATTTGGIIDPGYWGNPTPYSPIPACECDTELTDTVTQECPSNLQGDLIFEREWDCQTGNWEEEENWELVDNNCRACSWQPPSTGSPTISDWANDNEAQKPCDCDSPPDSCYSQGPNNKFDIWSVCQCSVQED